ncbi:MULTISPECIES: DUF6087 family protein [Streptomyces]|uniref:Uncharacterized protein n=2 Tax=Actinomycetes TaxID=1760 RepID=A0ABP6A2Z0_9ACTN|nr:DUF6087 family protein [Streptomyces sp. CMSTAAHL-2]MCE3033690.1 DUF6087 family protein [Streptomyces sp. CMSTAAHL-2]
MDDEPLSDWAERHDAKIGRLRAVPLVSEEPKGSLLNTDAPRVIQRWNGHVWEPHACAANLAEAQRFLRPRLEEPLTAPASQLLRTGRGRYRKPRPGE